MVGKKLLYSYARYGMLQTLQQLRQATVSCIGYSVLKPLRARGSRGSGEAREENWSNLV